MVSVYNFRTDFFADSHAQLRADGQLRVLGPGRSPCLLVIDGVQAYVADGSPLAVTDKSYVQKGKEAIDFARGRDIPIIYTRVSYEPGGPSAGVFGQKVSSLDVFGSWREDGWGDILDEWAPSSEDAVLSKRYASAFTGTDLVAELVLRRVDSLIIIGTSTSGCVRTTAVNACELGFRPVVVGDACGDRALPVHEASLYDIDLKYGDVVTTDDLTGYFGAHV